MFNRLIDRLIDWSIDRWLTNYTVADGPTALQTNWLIDWLMDWLID